MGTWRCVSLASWEASMCHCQLSPQPGTPSNQPQIPKTHRWENSKQQQALLPVVSLFISLQCITMASQGYKARVPYLHVCVSRVERRDERESLCSQSVQHLSPSWGCCDYLVEIATLSTQTKLTMANDPWTGIDSCRKCRQCSLHPEWIRYLHFVGPLSSLPNAHTHTYTHTQYHHHYMLPMWFI